MIKLFKYFTAVRKDLLTLLLIAFLNYLLIEFWFNSIPELFAGANKLGQLSSKLSISYISGFIFYFIVVHIKAERDKENINEWVGYKVHSIITSSHLFFQPFLKLKDDKLWFSDWDKEDRSNLLASIKRIDNRAPYIIDDKNGTWLQWWEYLKSSVFDSFKEIYLRYNHVDTELIKILTRLENCMFFSQWEMLYYVDYDPTFKMYDTQIKTYLTHLKDLENYADKNLGKYKTQTSEFMGYKNEY